MLNFRIEKMRNDRWVSVGVRDGVEYREVGNRIMRETGLDVIKVIPLGEAVKACGFASIVMHAERSKHSRKGKTRDRVLKVVTYANGSPFKGS